MDSDGYGKNVKIVDEKEDDIDIDFSKIKSWFGKKKTEKAAEEQTKPTEPDTQKSEDSEIDFSKIKKWFKSKVPSDTPHSHDHHDETKQEHEAKAHEDLSVHDHGNHATTHGKTHTTEDDEFDVRKAWAGINSAFSGQTPITQYMLILLTILGIAFSVWLGVSIRMEAGDLAFTEGWARNSIQQAIQNDLNAYYQQQFPQLSDQARQNAINQDLTRIQQAGTYTFRTGGYQGQSMNLQQQVDLTANEFKKFYQYDESKGYNYMPDIDPYYWWRFAQNKVETGHIGDEVRDGRQYVTAQLAPVGRYMLPQDQFYPRSIVWFYDAVQLFDSDADLLRTLMLYPVFIMALTIAIVFLIGRRIGGNIAGFFAAVMVGVHPALMTRTLFGHADSDAIAVFFSVLVLWLFVESFMAKRGWVRILFAALSGIATGVYSLTWGGWWWIFDFILAASLGSIAFFIIYEAYMRTRKQFSVGNYAKKGIDVLKGPTVRKELTTIGVYYLVSGIFISISWGILTFLLTPLTSLGFTSIKTPVVANAFPNVLRTVAELNEGTVRQAIEQLSPTLFYIAVAGILLIGIRVALTMWKHPADKNKIITDIFHVMLLSLWLVITLYSVTKGIRFVLLIVPAFSIAFGVVFGMLAHYISDYLGKEFKFNKLAVMSVLFVFFFLFFPQIGLNHDIVNTSRAAAQNDVPIINDAWYNALIAIRDNSEEEAIITSWWDFGHHFKALSGRSVTFDGTTQNTPQAHWVGRLLMTGDENEAIGILRMLDCGATTANELIQEEVVEPVDSVMLTKKIILLSEEDARATLENEGIENVDAILNATHCEPPQAFIIASEDMIGKSGVWGHFGGWNFTKADIWKETQEMSQSKAISYMQNQHELSDDEANRLWNEMQNIQDDRAADAWISPWPGISNDIQGCGVSEDIVTCGDGLRVDLTTNNASYATQNGDMHPASIIILGENGAVHKREYTENVIPQHLSVLLVPQGQSYFRVVATPEMVESVFLRLFFANAHGLEHFKLLTHQTGFTGNSIYVWEVDWKGGQNNSAIAPIQVTPVKNSVSEGDEVTLQYIGYYSNGTVFDSSIQGNVTNDTAFPEVAQGLTFTTGAGEVIVGFEEGVIGAALGEERVIEVTPDKGYTTPAHPLYNQTLYFRVRIDAIE